MGSRGSRSIGIRHQPPKEVLMPVSSQIKASVCKITVSTGDGEAYTLSTVYPAHIASKKDKGQAIRDMADRIADFVEMPRKKRGIG